MFCFLRKIDDLIKWTQRFTVNTHDKHKYIDFDLIFIVFLQCRNGAITNVVVELPTFTYQKMNNRNQLFCFEVCGLSCGNDEFDDKKGNADTYLFPVTYRQFVQFILNTHIERIKILSSKA